MMEELYKERIISLYKSTNNRGVPEHFTHKIEGKNPTCGDLITLYVLIENNEIKGISFEGIGCSVSIAAIQLLIDELVGKNISQLKSITDKHVIELLGIEISHAREKCATLGIRTLRTIDI